MAWLKIDDRVRTHPKIVEAGPLAAWVWFCGICYCREQMTDGFIADKMLATLVPGLVSSRKAVGALVRAGLWHRVERGYQVHDFLDWNPSREKVEELRAVDRERKGIGLPSDSRWKTSGPPPDSDRKPAGSRTDSEPSRDARTGLGSGSLSGVGASEGGSGETAERSSGRIVMSPAEFDRLLLYNAYVGVRLRVPHKLHSDFVATLGGDDPDARLRVWYGEVDTEIEQSREAIVPSVWKWLDARFKDWATSTAVDPEWAKIDAWVKEGS